MERKTFIFGFFCLILFSIFSVEVVVVTAQIVPVKVGVVIEMSDYGKMAMTCLSMAVSDFYSTHAHYTTRLNLISRDSKGSPVGAAAAALDLIKNVQVQAIIGPTFSAQASFLISLGHKARVPIISYSVTSPALSSIPTPYFIRTTLNDSSQVNAIGAIIQAYRWREVVPIYEDNEFGEGIIPYLADALEDVHARIPYRSVIAPQATDDQIVTELYKLMTMQTRVFVVHMMSSLASRLFMKAKQLGMMSREYAWIITDGITYELNIMDNKVKESMLGVIGVKPYVPISKELEEFEIQFKQRVRQENPGIIAPKQVDFYLWAYDSVVALAMASEQAKLTNPKYIEANSSTNFTDLESFGISDAGPKLVSSLSGMQFKGLSGDFHLVDGQLQAPPFQIINMVGPGGRTVGYWTKENGIVKELNSNAPNTDTMPQSKLGSIIWPGDQMSPPKGWVIPTSGKKLRVGVPVKPGFADFVRVTWNPDNSTTIEGFSIEVFDAVMAALPYGVPYEYIPFATPDHNMAGSYTELTLQVSLGNFDVVAGDVTITADRSEKIDFTLPYTQSGVSMVVPFKNDETSTAWVFLRPLTLELWLMSFSSFVFMGGLIWILEHRINEEFQGPFSYQVGMVFWFAFSTMVFAQKERVISNLTKFVLIIWFLVVLILTQSYTASLTSMLTVQKLTPSINDVDYLIRNKQPVGYKYGSFVYELLKKMNFDDNQLKPYLTPEEMDDLLTKGSGNGGIVAAFHEDPYLKLFLIKYGTKYTMVGPLYKADGFGFVFPKGSPLVPDVSRSILHISEGQKMVDIERKWLSGISKYSDCSNTISNTPKNLGLGSFLGLFLIAIVAGLLALIIYLIMFMRQNWDVVVNKSLNLRMRIYLLFCIFKDRDPDSHTDKKKKVVDESNHGYSGDSPCRCCQSLSNPTSIIPSFEQSPESSYQQSPIHARTLFSPRRETGHARTSEIDELPRGKKPEIELLDKGKALAIEEE